MLTVGRILRDQLFLMGLFGMWSQTFIHFAALPLALEDIRCLA